TGTGTSTFAGGINLTSGCFAINGTCLNGGNTTVINSSGGGSWATTTSLVAGNLINYPNNNTDVVTVGGNSTTTAKYWFDPNVQKSYLSGKVGIGTATPVDDLDIFSTASSVGQVI